MAQSRKRLMLSGARDAVGAGHSVGYDSPSRFSRDYRRLFGAPPRRNAAELRRHLDEPAPARPLRC